MIRKPVSSTNLKSAGYDPATGTLEIEFNGGAVYRYNSVPPTIYTGLMEASSHGSYFHQNIKGRYGDHRIG